MTHEPSSSDRYDKQQVEHMRVLVHRLGLEHAKGGEPAAFIAAKALAELGLGTINPMMILAIFQCSPIVHYFVLQHQSNWIMRG